MSIENIDTKKAPHPLRRENAVLRFKLLLLHGMVAIGVVLLPVPAVGAHFLDAVLGHPAQLVLGLGGVGVALGDITGAACLDDVGDLLAAGLGESVDDIQHAVTLAGAQIADEEAACLLYTSPSPRDRG